MRSLVFDLLLLTVAARAAAPLPPPPPMRSLLFDLLLFTAVARAAAPLPPPPTRAASKASDVRSIRSAAVEIDRFVRTAFGTPAATHAIGRCSTRFGPAAASHTITGVGLATLNSGRFCCGSLSTTTAAHPVG